MARSPLPEFTGGRVKNQSALPDGSSAGEFEHIRQRAGKLIRRAAANLAGPPVVFNEPQHRGLISQGVIDEVRLGVGRDHQKRLALDIGNFNMIIPVELFQARSRTDHPRALDNSCKFLIT